MFANCWLSDSFRPSPYPQDFHGKLAVCCDSATKTSFRPFNSHYSVVTIANLEARLHLRVPVSVGTAPFGIQKVGFDLKLGCSWNIAMFDKWFGRICWLSKNCLNASASRLYKSAPDLVRSSFQIVFIVSSESICIMQIATSSDRPITKLVRHSCLRYGTIARATCLEFRVTYDS